MHTKTTTQLDTSENQFGSTQTNPNYQLAIAINDIKAKMVDMKESTTS